MPQQAVLLLDAVDVPPVPVGERRQQATQLARDLLVGALEAQLLVRHVTCDV
jgi:hypothetical protein